MKPRIWPILLASAIGLAILISMGVWQVQRLAWKNALIAEIDKRMSEAPLSISQLAKHEHDVLEDGTIVKLKMVGSFKPTQLRKITTLNGGVGFEILQGFVSTNGADILVSRGVVPEQTIVGTPEKPIEIVGLVRHHNYNQGRFDPNNNAVANQWYWWDVPAMYSSAGLAEISHTSTVLHLLPKSPGTEGLYVGPPKADLRNNHLCYAITWFGLAAALLVMTGVFVMRIVRTR
jgi:surfeit locus 1 family protein